jgi:multiple sugar transport system substrate-binding protein
MTLKRLPGRVLAFTLFIFILSFGVFGCQSPETKKQAGTITLSTWGSQQEIDVLKTLLKQFEANNPGVHVRLMHIPENYFQKIHLLIAGDLAPDVMLVNSLNYPVYASHHVFKDLRPLIKRDSLDLKDFYPKALQAFHRPDSSVIGVLPRDLSNLVVYYNADLFRKSNVSEPDSDWTWEHMLEKAKALTVRNAAKKQFGFSFFSKPPLYWLPFVWSASGDLWNQHNGHVVLNQAPALAGLQFYADLRNRYHVSPTRAESGDAVMSQLFLQQKLAMLVSGRWTVPVLREQAKFDWDVVPLPIGPSGKSRVGVDASGYAISAKTHDAETSWKLVRFLTSSASLREMAQSGLIIPAREEVAQTAFRPEAGSLPHHGFYFLDALTDGVPTSVPVRWNEFAEVLQLALDPVWEGHKSPTQAIKEAKPALEKLLRQEQKSR